MTRYEMMLSENACRECANKECSERSAAVGFCSDQVRKK